MADRIILIAGSGRTGTHWLGSSFAASGYHLVGEDHPGFELSVCVALGLARPDRLASAMAEVLDACDEHPTVVLKWHPSIWAVPALLELVPELEVVGTRRAILPTAMSMFHHAGTRRWVVEHEKYDAGADAFLGRLEPSSFIRATVPVRCALRAASHWQEVHRLQFAHPDRFAVFNYELAQRDPAQVAANIARVLGIELEIVPGRHRAHPPFDPADVEQIELIRRKAQRWYENLGP